MPLASFLPLFPRWGIYRTTVIQPGTNRRIACPAAPRLPANQANSEDFRHCSHSPMALLPTIRCDMVPRPYTVPAQDAGTEEKTLMRKRRWRAAPCEPSARWVPGNAENPPGYLPHRAATSLVTAGCAAGSEDHDLGALCPRRYGAGMERNYAPYRYGR